MQKKIMLVDDEKGVAYTVKNGLEKSYEDCKVTCVDSGKKCIELLENNNIPDLILLDIMMPEMNGWEVAKKIQQNIEWKKIPIIFLSAVEDKTSKLIGSMISADYIEKPFNIPELKQRIDKVLNKKEE